MSSRDLSSYESGTRNTSTEFSQYIEKSTGSIIQYKRQTSIISQFIYFISFLLVVAALFHPLFSMRNDCISCFNKLFNAGLPTITQHLTQMIENLLDKYQTTPIFYGSLFESPSLIGDTDEYIERFVSFAKLSYELYPIKPLALLFNSTNNIIYQVFFPTVNSSSCELYVQFFEGTQSIQKYYPSGYDFRNFNHSIDGVPVTEIPGMTNDFSSLFKSKEKWITKPAFFNNSYHTLLYANISPVPSICLILELDTLVNLIQSVLSASYFRFVFMTGNGGVLFDSDLGIVQPDDGRFLMLNELHSDFWDAVSTLQFNEFQEQIEINESLYLLHYGYIFSLDEVCYSFLIAVAKDNLMSIPLRKSALYFLFMLLFICGIYTFSQYLMIKNKEKCQHRLERADRSTIMNSYLIDSYSTLHNCIIQLRMLELMYPEEMVLNHVLDKIVQEISGNRYRHFVLKKKANCGFCNYITISQKVTKFKNEKCFDYWKKMFKYILPSDDLSRNLALNDDSTPDISNSTNQIHTSKKNLSDEIELSKKNDENLQLSSLKKNDEGNLHLSISSIKRTFDDLTNSSLQIGSSRKLFAEEASEFDLDECMKNPSQFLLKTFMKIIMTEGLLFQVFDPDVIFQYVFKFSTMLCSNCLQASFTLHQLHRIIHQYFSIWFTHKFDLFIVYFASMIYYSKIPEIESDNEREFQIDQQNENHPFIETNEEIVEKTKLQLHAINDKYSQNTRKYEFALDVFAECFKGIESNEMFIFFKSSIKQMLANLNDLMMFEVLGEFRVRIESPDFSIFQDDNDKILFCSALIKFSQFGLYYQKEKLMKELAENISITSLTPDERRNRLLVSEFHTFSIKIAQFWLEAFCQFTPMKFEEENLEKSKHYFELEQAAFHDEL